MGPPARLAGGDGATGAGETLLLYGTGGCDAERPAGVGTPALQVHWQAAGLR